METRSKSFLEVNCNVWLGLICNFIINFLVVQYAVPFFYPEIIVNSIISLEVAGLTSGIMICLTYIRSYLIRRYFDKKPDNWSPWRKIWKR